MTQEDVLNSRLQMNPKNSLNIYPRIDQNFKIMRSLNFDMMRSDVFAKRIEPKKYFWLFKWLAYFLIGFFTGIVAFTMGLFEDFLVSQRNSILEKLFNNNISLFPGWAFLMAWCVIISGLASFITIYIGPGAMGSGVPELMGYLNGVNYPKLISF